jgi:hypothetical protein
MSDVKVLPYAPEGWVARLRRGHKVWLAKEKEVAEIEFPYDEPEPRYRTGRIGIRRGFQLQSWFIDPNGLGIDGSILFLAVEGHCPDEPRPLPTSVLRQIAQALEQLHRRVASLERMYGCESDETPPGVVRELHRLLVEGGSS